MLLATTVFLGWSQDTRTVNEPVLRRACSVLRAKLTAEHGSLAATDERQGEKIEDTARIQRAIDECPAGQAVQLSQEETRNAFLTGALHLKTGVAIQIDADVVLFGSRDPRDFDVSPGSCGILSAQGHGCRAIINGDHADHAAVMGDGTIDGRGGEKILGQNISWWGLAEQARGTKQNQNCPRLLQLSHCNDFTLYRTKLRNSPNFHVFYSQGNGFTAWGVTIDTPQHARNTDGIDPASSTNVTITRCYIHAGDDQIAIKAGDGGSSSHMTIAHNHFYTGHGMSIGSETNGGVSAIRVSDLSIDGADNGIRIKSNSSRGGLVHNIEYDTICIRNTKNPIFMDSNYSFYGDARDALPTFRDIRLHNVKIEGGGKLTLDGYDSTHRLQMELDDVVWSGVKPDVKAVHADLVFGPGPVNFSVSGEDVQVKDSDSTSTAGVSCAAQFVPMPKESQ